MKLTSIDLFCGAGGLSIGLERAGFTSVMGLDTNSDAISTYRQAFPDAETVEQSVAGYDFRQWRGVDLVAGGPPCQPFSNGGKRFAANDDRDMIPEFARAVNEIMPRAFIMENVAGLLAPRNREYLGKILSLFSDGYTMLSPRLVNAADYGVPQKRVRVVLIGLLNGGIDFPSPTHTPGRYVTAGSVLRRGEIRGQPNPSKVVYAKKPDLRPSPFAGQLFNGGGRAINLNQPAPTILASAGGNKTHFIDELDGVPPYHKHLWDGGKPRCGEFDGGRRITVLESALLQTFPADMLFSGSRSSQYAQIGNAVPPRLAKVIGASVARALH
ncbi:DNA cytosine methyltransferase [Salibaculum halophilum]|uniref:DNA cytosine methyltransferase n=1 Tax=Salibaculum halophilum TaxID=1914408 RepID=UPI001C4FEB2F|nr:DNA cytosine methyltransferase [Salibaculum halophilum]